MKSSESGQALVEWAMLMLLYGLLFGALLAFGQWFAIRHQLIAAVRQAAFLYSSGRITVKESQLLVQQTLLKGHPSLHVDVKDIHIGPRKGFHGLIFRLDEVRIVYHRSRLMEILKFNNLEETCVIKHAPSYWQTEIPGANLGPPVSW